MTGTKKEPSDSTVTRSRSWRSVILPVGMFVLGILIGRYARSRQLSTIEPSAYSNPDSSAGATFAPAGPEKYQVKDGDSLSSIGAQFGVPWEAIASTNELISPYQVKAGTILLIPPKDQVAAAADKLRSALEKKITIDSARLAEAQKEVPLGHLLWRLDPVEVVKKDAPIQYKFSDQSLYFLKSKDTALGEAVVEVDRAGKRFTVHLIQPVDKGLQGVWAIDNIKGQP